LLPDRFITNRHASSSKNHIQLTERSLLHPNMSKMSRVTIVPVVVVLICAGVPGSLDLVQNSSPNFGKRLLRFARRGLLSRRVAAMEITLRKWGKTAVIEAHKDRRAPTSRGQAGLS
jgi:hypothetical protein